MWKVMSNHAGGEVFYQVYRMRDPDDIDHSGNREIIGCFDEEERAQEFADAKNKLEEENGR